MASDSPAIIVKMPTIEPLLAQLSGFPKQVHRANYSAAKRTADHVITNIGREVSKRYALPQNKLKRHIKSKRLIIPKFSKTMQGYQILIKGHLLPTTAFPHTIKITEKKDKLGNVRKKVTISARVLRSNRRRKIVRKNEDGSIASAFLKMPRETSDTDGLTDAPPVILVRKSRQRGPLMEPKVLSIPQMITNDEVADQIAREAQEWYLKRITHEVENRIQKMAEKVNKA